MNKIPINFPIEVFDMEKASDTLTKARLRIFYKGANRNGSYISDEFAEKLIKTLPYTPVKGIYDEDDEDFTHHGQARSQGRIYGVVPDESRMNFSWEKHIDEDGIEREYATTDVLIFTALYEEADDVVGKAQSMELYLPSIKGQWIDIGGASLYKYSEASFLGLQILGDSATPCFQGSAFFSLESTESQHFYILLTNIFEKLDQLTIGRTIEMANENVYNPTFALSDRQKQDKLFQALNTETVRYWVVDTYEDYAIVYDMEQESYAKVSYTKNDEAETVTVADDMAAVFVEFVTEEEKNALSALRAKTETGTYEAASAAFDTNVSTISEMQVALDNKDVEISTLNTGKKTFEQTIQTLEGKLQEFENYKESIETAEKEAVIAKYSEKLGEEILTTYTGKLTEFTVDALEKELAYELVKSDVSIFTKGEDAGYVPKSSGSLTGLEALLTQYKK